MHVKRVTYQTHYAAAVVTITPPLSSSGDHSGILFDCFFAYRLLEIHFPSDAGLLDATLLEATVRCFFPNVD